MYWLNLKIQQQLLMGKRKQKLAGKGALNNQITSLLFKKLEEENIPSHFIEKISETEQLVKKVSNYSA